MYGQEARRGEAEGIALAVALALTWSRDYTLYLKRISLVDRSLRASANKAAADPDSVVIAEHTA